MISVFQVWAISMVSLPDRWSNEPAGAWFSVESAEYRRMIISASHFSQSLDDDREDA